MMHHRTSGIVSLAFAGIAMTVAIYSIAVAAGFLAVAVYLAAATAGAAAVLRGFCAKCPHLKDGSCRHVIIGPLAAMLSKPRIGEPYTTADIATLAAVGAVVLLAPQYWLWKAKPLFILFWVLLSAAAAVVAGRVCVTCANAGCPCKRMPRK